MYSLNQASLVGAFFHIHTHSKEVSCISRKYPENPYGVSDVPATQKLAESVNHFGVLVPANARPKVDSIYELIAGQWRKRVSQLAGWDSMPVIVMNLDDKDAIIQLVDSSIQRESVAIIKGKSL